jgi:hypothetical protein
MEAHKRILILGRFVQFEVILAVLLEVVVHSSHEGDSSLADVEAQII